MASRRPSTRANPKGPPATPVSNLEEILRRDRDSLRYTNSAAKEASLGISRNIYAIISSAETLNSQEFINTSEILGFGNLQALFLVKISSLVTQ